MLFKAFLISAFSLASMVSGAAVSTVSADAVSTVHGAEDPTNSTANVLAARQNDVSHCESGAPNYGHAVELNRCINNRLASNAGFGDFTCEGRRFFLGGRNWNNAGDCARGCLPCLRNAADRGQGWVHCEQSVQFATCWIGYCVPGEPCYDW